MLNFLALCLVVLMVGVLEVPAIATSGGTADGGLCRRLLPLLGQGKSAMAFAKAIEDVGNRPPVFSVALSHFRPLQTELSEVDELAKMLRRFNPSRMQQLEEAHQFAEEIEGGKFRFSAQEKKWPATQNFLTEWKNNSSLPLFERVRAVQPALDSLKGVLARISGKPEKYPAAKLVSGMDDLLEIPPMFKSMDQFRKAINESSLRLETLQEIQSSTNSSPQSETPVVPEGRYVDLYQKLLSAYASPAIQSRLNRGPGEHSWEETIHLRQEGDRWVLVPEGENKEGAQAIQLQKVKALFKGKSTEPIGFLVSHGSPSTKSRVFEEYISQLWEEAIQAPSPDAAARKIAEFEGVLTLSHYAGGSGSATADAMSLSLQIRHGLKLREGTRRVDFDVMSAPSLQSYIQSRRLEMIP